MVIECTRPEIIPNKTYNLLDSVLGPRARIDQGLHEKGSTSHESESYRDLYTLPRIFWSTVINIWSSIMISHNHYDVGKQTYHKIMVLSGEERE